MNLYIEQQLSLTFSNYDTGLRVYVMNNERQNGITTKGKRLIENPFNTFISDYIVSKHIKIFGLKRRLKDAFLNLNESRRDRNHKNLIDQTLTETIINNIVNQTMI